MENSEAVDSRAEDTVPPGDDDAGGSPAVSFSSFTAPDTATEVELGEPSPGLEDELLEAREEAAKYLDLAQRAQAELINFRKRVENERAEVRKYATEEVVAELMPVRDSLAQAVQVYGDVPEGDNPLLDGVRRTIVMLDRVLGRHGVQIIAEADVPFDAELHQALLTEPSASVTVETVSEVYQPGVRIGERVVKPAMVKVLVPATSPAAEDSSTDSATGGDETGEREVE